MIPSVRACDMDIIVKKAKNKLLRSIFPHKRQALIHNGKNT
jgi:hypothetical protein